MMLGTVEDTKVVIISDRNLEKHVARHFPHLSYLVRRWGVLYLMIRVLYQSWFKIRDYNARVVMEDIGSCAKVDNSVVS